MGYRIDYGQGKKRGRVLPLLLTACFFTLLGVCLVPQGRQAVWGMLTGGSGERIQEASAMLQRALTEGEAMAASAWALCREAVAGLG